MKLKLFTLKNYPLRSFLILLFLHKMAITLLAQESPTLRIDIGVSATVIGVRPVEIITLQNIFLSGSGTDTSGIYISPVSSPDAGLMQLNGVPNSNVRISFLLAEDLANEDGSKITIRYELSGNRERIQRASRLIDTGEEIVKLSDSGEFYLWIGGRLQTSLTSKGKFFGRFTIEIEYI